MQRNKNESYYDSTLQTTTRVIIIINATLVSLPSNKVKICIKLYINDISYA